MYCGARTERGKKIWGIYAALLVPTIIAWIVVFVYSSKCSSDIEDQGCNTEITYNIGSSPAECEADSCTTGSVFLLIAIVLSILTAIPCCCCCCCSDPPTKQHATAEMVPAGQAYGIPAQGGLQGAPQYNQTGQYSAPYTGPGQQYSAPYTGPGQQYTGSGQYGQYGGNGTAQPTPPNY